jgi:hypothetical protein
MQPHQQRVVDEKAHESEKLGKLEAFLSTPIYASLPPDEQARLVRQSLYMRLFVQVLSERIAAF